MPEGGGAATQAGIYYQNSVAALVLADLLDLDRRVAREHIVEVRLEVPGDVDDVVLREAERRPSVELNPEPDGPLPALMRTIVA